MNTHDGRASLARQRPISSQPGLQQHGVEIQRYGTLRQLSLALSFDARAESCQLLNQILADCLILYALYKKHHWMMREPTFYQLHLLRDKHAEEQLAVMLSRLLEAHETIVEEVRTAIDKTAQNGDSGTNDLLMSDVLRTNELQAWFLTEHLVDIPVVDA